MMTYSQPQPPVAASHIEKVPLTDHSPLFLEKKRDLFQKLNNVFTGSKPEIFHSFSDIKPDTETNPSLSPLENFLAEINLPELALTTPPGPESISTITTESEDSSSLNTSINSPPSDEAIILEIQNKLARLRQEKISPDVKPNNSTHNSSSTTSSYHHEDSDAPTLKKEMQSNYNHQPSPTTSFSNRLKQIFKKDPSAVSFHALALAYKLKKENF